MGYDGDALRAQFRPDKNRERQEASASVTAPRSRERQEALSAINTAGKRFFATGGGTHQMEDDLLIGQEIGDRKKRVAELEKERKKRLDFFERREAALIVLDRLEHDLAGDVSKLSDTDLKKLLMWKGVALISKRERFGTES